MVWPYRSFIKVLQSIIIYFIVHSWWFIDVGSCGDKICNKNRLWFWAALRLLCFKTGECETCLHFPKPIVKKLGATFSPVLPNATLTETGWQTRTWWTFEISINMRLKSSYPWNQLIKTRTIFSGRYQEKIQEKI